MLTFFTTAKPFCGHTAIIQRNALESWKRVHRDAEVILFGDDDGAAEAAHELGLRYEPHVERSAAGTKRLDYLFSTARAIAVHDILCYANCDIVLMQDFRQALERVRAAHEEFLLVGRRWDVEIWEFLDFSRANWQSWLRALALSRGRQRTAEWIDYFAFNRGLYGASVPPLVVGRVYWDNWLVWKARSSGAAVVDASDVVIALHQNHGYGYHPQGKYGVWHDEEANRNRQLAGNGWHLRTIADATEVLEEDGLRRNWWRYWEAVKRSTALSWRVMRFNVWHPIWFWVLGITRPLRQAMGLRAAMFHRRSREHA